MKPQDALEFARRAKSNLKAAFTLFNEGLLEESCIMAHDAAEKAIKAVLFANNVDPGIVHLIERMIPDVEKYIPSISVLKKEIESVDLDYMPSRYPSKAKPPISHEDAGSNYETSNKICKLAFDYLSYE